MWPHAKRSHLNLACSPDSAATHSTRGGRRHACPDFSLSALRASTLKRHDRGQLQRRVCTTSALLRPWCWQRPSVLVHCALCRCCPDGHAYHARGGGRSRAEHDHLSGMRLSRLGTLLRESHQSMSQHSGSLLFGSCLTHQHGLCDQEPVGGPVLATWETELPVANTMLSNFFCGSQGLSAMWTQPESKTGPAADDLWRPHGCCCGRGAFATGCPPSPHTGNSVWRATAFTDTFSRAYRPPFPGASLSSPISSFLAPSLSLPSTAQDLHHSTTVLSRRRAVFETRSWQIR